MRKIIKDNYGVFDKFTGDGFLCYFNSHLCEQLGKDYYEQLIKACKEIMDFSNSFFSDWVKNIRKLPPNSSGLTIGIDSGVVKFRDLDNHLFAIGESIVWANRMSSAGEKEEIVLNNIPYHKINDSQQDIEFESIQNVTKGGESFTAYKMKIK
jgi:class 3 adenylate cyclase